MDDLYYGHPVAVAMTAPQLKVSVRGSSAYDGNRCKTDVRGLRAALGWLQSAISTRSMAAAT